MSRRVLALASLLLVVVVGPALAAQPSRRDHADALAYYAAARSFSATLLPAVAGVPDRVDRQVAGCPGSFTGASESQVDEAKAAASDLEVFRAILPRYARFVRVVDARHARSPVLRRISSSAGVINREMQKYAKLRASVCTLGADWQAAGWTDGFTDTWMQQLDTDAGADQSALKAAERRIAAAKAGLIALGLTAKQASDLVGIASLT